MVYVTRETEGAAGAPLLFTFHGTGGDETQFHGLAERLVPGAHVVSPRGNVLEAGMNRYFRRTGEGIYDMDDLAARTTTMEAFIEDWRARTGAPRVLGFGYSNGANVLASVVFRNPGLFNAVALLHPLIPWTPDPAPGLGGCRVLVTAGRRDPICPAPMTEALIEWFKKQGAYVDCEWHSGGHEIIPAEIEALARFLGQPVAS